MQQIDVCVWFDSQAQAETNIGVSLVGNAKLNDGEAGQEWGQKQGKKQGKKQGRKQDQQQAARDAQTDRLHNAVAASCLA